MLDMEFYCSFNPELTVIAFAPLISYSLLFCRRGMNVFLMLGTTMRSENIPLSIDLQNQLKKQYALLVEYLCNFHLYVCRRFIFYALCNQVIGDNNLIMGSCHIAHDCNVGNYNIFANNTLLAGHVVVKVSSMCL